MSMPNPRQPQETGDEALDILRRLEPVLARAASRDDISKLDDRIAKLDDRLRKVEETVARLDGRVSQMPTTWQLLIGVVGIIGLVFTLLRFGGAH